MNAMLKKLNSKRNGKKGFTLMEMLIVIAIIAILVAIAIPTFNNALDSAKMRVDEANIRAAYAQYQVDTMLAAVDSKTSTVAVATPATALAAFTKIGVTDLQYYGGVEIPKNGSKWIHNASTGGCKTLVEASFTVK